MSRMSFAERDREIIRRIDILSEAQRLGLVLASGATVSESGWVRCHAIGREDQNPSGSLNVGDGPERGWYRDYAHDEHAVSFFEFAARSGKFLDWRIARDHYALEHGVRSRPKEFKKGLFLEFKKAVLALLRSAEKDLKCKVVGQIDDHAYHNIDGSETYIVLKFRSADGRKACRSLYETPEGWRLGLPKDRVLYRLPQLLAADPALPVLFVEGEKDADAAAALGFVVTTNVNGSKSWRGSYAEHLRDRAVVIICDNDDPGRDLGDRVGRSLAGIASSTRIIRAMPGVLEKGDLSDWIAMGGTAAELQELLINAEEFVAPAPAPKSNAECVAPKAISNATLIESEESKEYVAKDLPLIAKEIYLVTNGWPRRIGSSLFVVAAESREIQWIQTPPDLMSYLGDQCNQPPLIKETAGFHTKAEILSHLSRKATEYKSIQLFPHEPLIEGIFYNCDIPQPGTGQRLQEFLAFFTFETELDRGLFQAFLMTLLWGGKGGLRPAWVVTADSGRGAGKTTAVKFAASLFGGTVELRMSEDADSIYKRLLSNDALMKRMVLLDNLKSEYFSSPDLESLVSSETISGRQLFKGEGRRPNLLTYCFTVNGAALSKDLAQRVVVIKLGCPTYAAEWQDQVSNFVEKHREEIIADLIASLRGPIFPLGSYTRWATWEQDVLQRVPDAGKLQKLILERQQEANMEQSETEELLSHIQDELAKFGLCPETEKIFIPSNQMTQWYNTATNGRVSPSLVTRRLKQLAKELPEFPIQYCPQNGSQRGHIWFGKNSSPTSIVNRQLVLRKETFKSPFRSPQEEDRSPRNGDTWGTV